MEIILIGKGFISKNLYNFFVKSKKTSIFGMRDLKFNTNNCNFKKLNINNNKKYTVVFTASIPRLRSNNFNEFKENINIALNLEKLMKYSAVKKIIYLSTIDLYKNNNKIINENSQIEVTDFYSISKLFTENLIKLYANNNNKIFIIIRLPGVFGYGDRLKSSIGKMLFSAKQNKSIILSNKGNTKRDFIYIKDLQNIFVKIIRINNNYTFNVVSGQSKSLNFIAEKIRNNIPNIKILKTNKKNVRDYDLKFDNSKVKKILNFKFSDLDKSIKEYILLNAK